MDRDIRTYFLCIALPALVLTAVGLITLVFGVRGLTAELRSPGYGEQLERYERNAKARAARFAKSFARNGKADFVWAAAEVPWGTNAPARVKYGCYGATNDTAIAWARLGDGRVAGFRVPPFRYEDRRNLYLAVSGAVMAVLLFLILFAGGYMLARGAKRMREDIAMKNTFLDVVSHELNTPLGSIVPLASALAADEIKSERHRREALETVRRESVRMARMIEELLTVVRLRNGKVRYAREAFDLCEVAENAASLVRMRYPDCAIRVEADGRVAALADRDKVEQVAINLIENACRYAGDDTIDVACRLADGGRVQLSVADRGAGIPAEERGRLFERFYQMPGDGSQNDRGLGLGLNIVAGFVKGMHGSVKVSARQGGGSVFAVELPACGSNQKGDCGNG